MSSMVLYPPLSCLLPGEFSKSDGDGPESNIDFGVERIDTLSPTFVDEVFQRFIHLSAR